MLVILNCHNGNLGQVEEWNLCLMADWVVRWFPHQTRYLIVIAFNVPRLDGHLKVSVQGRGDGLLNGVRVSCSRPLSCGKSGIEPLAVGVIARH